MNIKKSFIANIIACMVLILSIPAFASANENTNESTRTINLSYGENYENKETGEYFRWVDVQTARGTVAKHFEFKIRFSVQSTSFTIDSSSVTVDASAYIEDEFGNSVSGYSGHKYTIQLLRGLTTKSLQFDLGGTESGTISGLTSGGSYTLKVINNDYLSLGDYLTGSGTITNN
ncbi:hypothetical protein [Paenibacillus bouchesdurhonensis]|uniref:hypothetical protein n=1 Tax=Paenibacillus bouchesdurhonensis TaxID=1870990 RepID=UPI000DA636D2|nr:hypothetical protein [Paenibacillus bouchesdurhonensis]